LGGALGEPFATKSGALVALLEHLQQGSDAPALAGRTLDQLLAADLRRWSQKRLRKPLSKDRAVEALLASYCNDQQATASSVDVAMSSSSKATILAGNRLTTLIAYRESTEIDRPPLIIEGRCRKCGTTQAFRQLSMLQDLGEGIAWVGNKLGNLAATVVGALGNEIAGHTTSAERCWCSACDYMQKVCGNCHEISDTTASQCSGCGRKFA
jgi:hypothetical protein